MWAIVFGPKLERKQGFLFRAVDVALELFAITASIRRAHSIRGPERAAALLLADQFARSSRRRVDDILRDMWSNDDTEKLALSKSIMDGEQTWLEHGTIGLPFSVEQLRPETMDDYLKNREHRPATVSESRPLLPRTG